MTSAVELDTLIEPAPVIWITGLAGVGKTTLACAVIAGLHRRGLHPLMLDGDEVRIAFEGEDESVVNHACAHRAHRAGRLSRLARLASRQGIPVVVATISLFHDVQDWNRCYLPRYREVLMRADIELLRARRPALYGPRGTAAQPNVVGVDIDAEFPAVPELTIAQRFDPEELAMHADNVIALFDAVAAS